MKGNRWDSSEAPRHRDGEAHPRLGKDLAPEQGPGNACFAEGLLPGGTCPQGLHRYGLTVEKERPFKETIYY